MIKKNDYHLVVKRNYNYGLLLNEKKIITKLAVGKLIESTYIDDKKIKCKELSLKRIFMITIKDGIKFEKLSFLIDLSMTYEELKVQLSQQLQISNKILYIYHNNYLLKSDVKLFHLFFLDDFDELIVEIC